MPRSALLPVLAVLLVPALLVPSLGGGAHAQGAQTLTQTRGDGSSVSTRGAEPAGRTGPMTAAPISPLSNTPSPSAADVGGAGTTAGSGSSCASASVGSSAGGAGAIGLGGISGSGIGGGIGQNSLGDGAGAGGHTLARQTAGRSL